MPYQDLHELIDRSSSSRRYFLSLPVSTQLSVSEYGNWIRTAAQLHAHVDRFERYEHAVENSEYYEKRRRLLTAGDASFRPAADMDGGRKNPRMSLENFFKICKTILTKSTKQITMKSSSLIKIKAKEKIFMKRRFALLTALVFVFAGFASTASAAVISPTVFYQTEKATVLDGVQKDTYQNGLGQTVIQYSGLDAYIDKSLTISSNTKASLEVAKEIIKEVRGAEVLSILPEEYILEALTYEEAFQTISYIKTNQDGTAQYMQEDEIMQEIAEIKQTALSAQSELPSDFVNDRTSSDGYMRLVTTAVRVSDPPTCYDDRNHYYLISVYSEWLIRPTYTYEDLLALAYGTAVYDDNYGVYAYISQSEACKYCDYTDSLYYEEIYRNDTPSYNNSEASDHIEIDFPGGCGVSCYVNFVSLINLCNHYIEEADIVIGGSYPTKMASYLQTRVYSQSWDFEVRAGYSHKWTGIDSISVSFSEEGASIGFSGATFKTDYFGTPLTVTYLSSINPSFPSPFSKGVTHEKQ